MPNEPHAPLDILELDRSTAIAICPRRDPLSACTICYIQPVPDSDQVDLFSATGLFRGRQPASQWPADPVPAS